MRNISSYDDVIKIVNNARKMDFLSNFAIPKARLISDIESGKLFFLEANGNIFFLEAEEDFYRMFYFINELTEIIDLALDRDIVVEFPFRGEYSERQIRESKILLESGFELARESALMELNSSDVDVNSDYSVNGLLIKTGVKSEINIYEKMLRGVFNPLFAFIPDKNELNEKVKQEQIYIAYYQNEISGILTVEFTGNIIWTSHIMVDKKFRGLGIGYALLQYVHKLYAVKCRGYKCWVDTHNISSVRLHEKTGYKFASRKANEYVKYMCSV